jgi:hypothetical protein
MVGPPRPPDAGFFPPLEEELIADEVWGSIWVGSGSRLASTRGCLACVLAEVCALVSCVDILRRYHAFAQSRKWRERERDGTSVPVSSPGSQILKPASVKSPISA